MSAREQKNCQNCSREFVVEPEDFDFYEKLKVPPPTWCPECRLIRRFLFRNERYLYKAKCALCSKDMFSLYPPESDRALYCQECWWGDGWDQLKTGRDYNFSRPFFEQLHELMKAAPVANLWTTHTTLVNSDYNNLAGYLKNCYMVSHADHNEDCAYASGLKFSKNCFDVTMVQESELSYECLDVMKGYQNFYSADCEGCHNIWFSRNLIGCHDCFGCINLRNKSYHIFNEQYSKEEYEKKVKEFNLGSSAALREMKKRVERFWLGFPNKYYHGTHNQNVSGDYIYNSKNVRASYEIGGAENCKHIQFASVKITTDSYDYTEWGLGADLIYESMLCGDGVSQLKFMAMATVDVKECEYSHMIISSSNCFGCVGLRKQNYCILNKQYLKDDYFALRDKIIQHMSDMPYVDKQGRTYKYGEFFPPELSPQSYNTSTAQEFFPKTKEEALAQGMRWRDVEDKTYTATIRWDELPDTIGGAGDDILKQVILCRAWDEDAEKAKEHNCTKAFRLTSTELQFYRRMNLPLPKECPNTRHYERTKWRQPIKFWTRKCQCASAKSENGIYANSASHFHGTDHCPNEFETSYAPERKEIVYCEACYNAEVA